MGRSKEGLFPKENPQGFGGPGQNMRGAGASRLVGECGASFPGWELGRWWLWGLLRSPFPEDGEIVWPREILGDSWRRLE